MEFMQRNLTLIVDFQSETERLTKRFFSLGQFEMLFLENLEFARTAIEEKHEQIAIVLINLDSFPDDAESFYREMKSQERFENIKIVLAKWD